METGRTFWRNSRYSKRRYHTCVVTPDLNELFGTSEGNNPVPTLEDIIKTTSINDIDQLQVSSSTKYTARNIIPIPPFMINRLSLTIQAT